MNSALIGFNWVFRFVPSRDVFFVGRDETRFIKREKKTVGANRMILRSAGSGVID